MLFRSKKLTKQLPIVKDEILSVISDLDNPEFERLLIYKYIDWLTWKQIADKMFYSSASVRRMHDKCMEAIGLITNGNDEQA